MNKYEEAYNEIFKMYVEGDIQGSMWFRHNLDIIKELVDKEKVADDGFSKGLLLGSAWICGVEGVDCNGLSNNKGMYYRVNEFTSIWNEPSVKVKGFKNSQQERVFYIDQFLACFTPIREETFEKGEK